MSRFDVAQIQEAFRGRGERILLVEHDEAVRAFAVSALGENGYVIFVAASAAEALDVFEREKENVDLVCSDVVLPDKSGLDLIDELRSRNPELMVLLSSGYTGQRSQWPVIRERGFRYLQKPYALPDLLRALREVIERS